MDALELLSSNFVKDNVINLYLEQEISKPLLDLAIVDAAAEIKDDMRRQLLNAWWYHQGDFSGAYTIKFTTIEEIINPQDETDQSSGDKLIKMTLTAEKLS